MIEPRARTKLKMPGGFRRDRQPDVASIIGRTVSAILRNDYGSLQKKGMGKERGERGEEEEGREVPIRAVKMALKETTEGKTATMDGPRAASHLSLAASSTEQSG